MKHLNLLVICCLATCLVALTSSRSAAQTSGAGSLELRAQVTPFGGRAEPARELSFYLLRRHVAEIRKDVEQADPPLTMARFIEGLEVSTELKAWMKKNETVDLSGVAFTKRLRADEIMAIPEFLEGFRNLNGAMLNASLPSLKMTENDRLKSPEKYKRAKEQYDQTLRRYITSNPQSIEGLDAELGDVNPSRQWNRLQTDHKRRTEQRVLLLAQTEHLAGKTVSNLDGQGIIRGIPAGHYSLTTLDVPAMAGEVRLQWDVDVEIRAGEITHIELSNLNALSSATSMAH